MKNKKIPSGLVENCISWRLAKAIDDRHRIVDELDRAWPLGECDQFVYWVEDDDGGRCFDAVLSTALHNVCHIDLSHDERCLFVRSYGDVCFAVVCAMSRMMVLMTAEHPGA